MIANACKKLSRENAGSIKYKRSWVKGPYIDAIRNALFILEHNGVLWLQNFQIHDWVLVTSQHHIKCQNMHVTPRLFDPNTRRDHDYDTHAKPRNLLDDLEHAASLAWRNEIQLHLPPLYQNVPILFISISVIFTWVFVVVSRLSKKVNPTFVNYTLCMPVNIILDVRKQL